MKKTNMVVNVLILADMFIVMNELVLRSLHDPAIHAHLKWLEEGWHGYLEGVLRQGKEQGLYSKRTTMFAMMGGTLIYQAGFLLIY